MEKQTSRKSGHGQLSRLRPEQAKAAKEINHLAEFAAENPYPVLRIAKDDKVLYSNQAGLPILRQWQCEPGRRIPGDWFDIVAETLNERKPHEADLECEGRVYSLTFTSLKDTDFVNVYGLDITSRKRIEEEREVMIKLLSLINSSNKMGELMKLVLVVLKDWSGCEAVGIRLQDGEDFPYYVTSGFSDDFIEAENRLCSVNEIGELIRDSQGRPFLECMCGNVISGRFDPSKPFFTERGSFWASSTTALLASTTETDRLAKMRNRCNTDGYESLALVPLRAATNTFGLLQFNDKRKGCFTPDRIALFESIADNLAIGLAQREAEQELEKSEEMFRSVFETSIIGVAICSPDKRWLYVNDRICEILGYSREELGGMTWDKLTHPDDLEADVSLFNLLLAGKIDRYDLEKRFIRKDGSVIYAKIYISCRRNRYGDVDYDIGLLEDITERKLAEEALSESEDKFKTLAEEALDAIVIHDGKKVIEVNKAFGTIWGWEPQETIGVDISEFMTDESLKLIEEKIKSGYDRPYEVVGIRRDGTRFSVEITGKPIRYKGRSARVGTARDVTGRKQAEQALRESEERLEAALDAAELGIWDWYAVAGQVTWAGHEAELFGFAENEFDGRYESFEKRVHPEDLPGLRASIKKSRDERTGHLYEYRIVRPDGSIHWLQGTGRWKYDDSGRPVRMLGAARDITARKQAEKDLQESEIRFRELFESMSSGVAVYEAVNKGEDFVFKNMNRAGELIEKIERTDIIGKKVTEAFPGVKELGLFEVFQRVWRTGRPEYQSTSFYKDGRISGWRQNYVYKLPTGEIVAVYDDVTGRKQAEEKMLAYQNRLKSLASQLALSEERQRRKTAMDLHDHIGQSLAFARMELEAARQFAAAPEVVTKLEGASSSILKVIDDIRSLTFDLSSPLLREVGLEAAIADWLEQKLEKTHRIRSQFVDDGQEKPLDEDLKAIMFRSVRELLTNVVKHARASKVRVAAQRIGDRVQIVVEDNGAGFDVEAASDRPARRAAFGLFSIEEQLGSLGGKCRIISEPGKGTKVILTAPVKTE